MYKEPWEQTFFFFFYNLIALVSIVLKDKELF